MRSCRRALFFSLTSGLLVVLLVVRALPCFDVRSLVVLLVVRALPCFVLRLLFALSLLRFDVGLCLYALLISLTSGLCSYSLLFSLTSSLCSRSLFFALTSGLCLYALLISLTSGLCSYTWLYFLFLSLFSGCCSRSLIFSAAVFRGAFVFQIDDCFAPRFFKPKTTKICCFFSSSLLNLKSPFSCDHHRKNHIL